MIRTGHIGHKYELYGRIYRRGIGSVVALAAMWSVMQPPVPAAAAEMARTREVVRYDNVEFDLIAEGRGPLIVMLPSRGRDSEDFDDVASRLAGAGYRVLRPQPRGAGKSTGPVEGIRLQDLARDVAHVIASDQD
jgi:pimeloyl-ACP methyl ester carboxylesterase